MFAFSSANGITVTARSPEPHKNRVATVTPPDARVRAPGGPAWYDAESVRQLCQMTGRGVRHEADRCETYVLDSEFSRLLSHRREMFPRWWLDAVKG